jgi:23S rRNA pseudouridine2605 synthase
MTDDPQSERIAKRLSRAGVASRREAEAMILAGRVAVNGRAIATPALNVGPSDRITVDGAPVAEPEATRLWRYHKPVGLVTTARDEKGRPTIFDRLPEDLPRVMSIGRLDLNSEGLLLLTNDGTLKRRLELPATGWMRKYRVRANGTASDESLEPVRRGITVEGERFQPMTVTLDRQQGSNVWLTVGLREGRNREVRRALASVGLTVNRLIRISYGPFQLGDLAPGQAEEIRPRILRDQIGALMKPERNEGAPRGRVRKVAGSAEPAAAKPARFTGSRPGDGPAPAGARPSRRGKAPGTPAGGPKRVR